MISRLSHFINKKSTTPVTIAALIIFVLFTALVLPSQANSADEYGGDSRSPDLSLFYSPTYVHDLAAEYGEAGREAYVRTRFTFDIVWPLVYTLFLSTSISWLFMRVFPRGSKWRLMNTAPLGAMILDLLENISSSLVMLSYPNPAVIAGWLAPVFTLLKWSLVGISFLLLLTGAALYILKWIRYRLSIPPA